ncbi:hypothetical protein HYV88_02360 [Candidatus Woesearchaeota archaeon]|nr:hypothetical protein [Candidatus Woesearchaeota archaeon]
MEDRLAELDEGIKIIGDKLIYTEIKDLLKTVKVFDLTTNDENIYYFEIPVITGFLGG